MNHREPPHRAAGLRRAWHYLPLLVLPALVSTDASGISGSHLNSGAALDPRNGEPVLLPYLATVGGPPLRFQTAPLPPDLTVRPAAGAPPIPTIALGQTRPAPVVETKLAPATAALTATPEFPAHADPAAPTKTPPPVIIPDDARPAIRPEDFLPYFQIPGGQAGGVNLLVPVPRGAPAPAPLSSSTATYTQSK